MFGSASTAIFIFEIRVCLNSLIFSGLDASVAGEIEEKFARAGYIVVSNSKNHRYDEDVPLLIPEVNADHLGLIKKQQYGKACPHRPMPP